MGCGGLNFISDEWREQNALLHQTNPNFGSKYVPSRFKRLRRWIKRTGAQSVLDYGCGKGTLVKDPKVGVPIRGYDPAMPEYANEPEPADIVVCWDVLEHIEPEHLEGVLRHIHSLGPVIYFTIGLSKDTTKLMPDGRNPHLIIEDVSWWLARLRDFWPRLTGEFTEINLEVIARC